MIINTETLKQAAENIIAKRNAEMYNDMLSKQNCIKLRCNAIIKQLDAIRAVAPAFNALKTAKIKFTKHYITKDEHEHISFSDCRNDLVGVYGGGIYGSSVFVNFENEKFIVCNWYTKDREINIDELIEKYWDDYMVRFHLGTIARDITAFAEAVAKKITACAQ